MRLIYINHSGFVLEGEHCTVIIDYYKDSDDRCINRSLASFKGDLYVCASHWHPDHFNREILKWKNIRPDTKYIFSRDILMKKLATPGDASYLDKGDCWQDSNLTVKAFGSTDVGISFLFEMEGKKVFHAGDLNNWHWDEESTPLEIAEAENAFLQELKTLSDETAYVDVAMFPVDARLGKNYMRGAEQFVDAIQTGLFVPMHFGQSYLQANAFRTYAEQAGCKFAAWTKTGEYIDF
jgi:L-ascorbate metabolism protein UlaG (beta-lactamase superfamily)